MVFRPKPHSLPRKPRSPAQDAATEKSFRIFRLRGLYEQCWLLTGANREAAQAAVDAELVGLGAEPHSERVRAREAEWRQRAPADEPDMFSEIPF